MEIKSGVLAIIAVIGLVLVSSLVILNDRDVDQTNDVLSVSGTSELTVNPDKAEIYLNVVTTAPTAGETQSSNKEISAKVIQALKTAGVKETDIETSNYYLNKKQDYDYKNNTYVDRGYELTHTIKVTTTSVDNVGSLVDKAIEAGANGVDRVSFGLTKELEKKVRAEALSKATIAAKEKAESIAKTTEVSLVKITSIQESNFYYMPYVANVRQSYDKEADGSVASSIIAPQKVDVTSSIQISYKIE